VFDDGALHRAKALAKIDALDCNYVSSLQVAE
jgi:hypothetical protein